MHSDSCWGEIEDFSGEKDVECSVLPFPAASIAVQTVLSCASANRTFGVCGRKRTLEPGRLQPAISFESVIVVRRGSQRFSTASCASSLKFCSIGMWTNCFSIPRFETRRFSIMPTMGEDQVPVEVLEGTRWASVTHFGSFFKGWSEISVKTVPLRARTVTNLSTYDVPSTEWNCKRQRRRHPDLQCNPTSNSIDNQN